MILITLMNRENWRNANMLTKRKKTDKLLQKIMLENIEARLFGCHKQRIGYRCQHRTLVGKNGGFVKECGDWL